MVWITRRCDFGHAHKVWTQERDNACGPSCMMMAYERITGQSPPDEKVFYEAYNLYGNDTKKTAKGKRPIRKTTGFQYTDARNLAAAMSKFVGKAVAKDVGKSNLVESVFGAMMGHAKPKPVIGLVNWSGGGWTFRRHRSHHHARGLPRDVCVRSLGRQCPPDRFRALRADGVQDAPCALDAYEAFEADRAADALPEQGRQGHRQLQRLADHASVRRRDPAQRRASPC